MSMSSTEMQTGLTRETILSVLPAVLRRDESAGALADALAQLLAERAAEVDLLRVYPRIDRLDEAALDILAYDLKVDWYDYDYPVEAKRSLIRGSVLAHKRLGSVYAVRSVLKSLYPDSAIEEWFRYGGKPGCFRLRIDVTDNAGGVAETYTPQEIDRRLAAVKRWSAHLESVEYSMRAAGTLRMGGLAGSTVRLALPELPEEFTWTGEVGAGGGCGVLTKLPLAEIQEG